MLPRVGRLAPLHSGPSTAERSCPAHDEEERSHSGLHPSGWPDLEPKPGFRRALIAYEMCASARDVDGLPCGEEVLLTTYLHHELPLEELNPFVLPQVKVARDGATRREAYLCSKELTSALTRPSHKRDSLPMQRVVYRPFCLRNETLTSPPPSPPNDICRSPAAGERRERRLQRRVAWRASTPNGQFLLRRALQAASISASMRPTSRKPMRFRIGRDEARACVVSAGVPRRTASRHRASTTAR